MTEYFELPTVNIGDFDINKPMIYWYEKLIIQSLIKIMMQRWIDLWSFV